MTIDLWQQANEQFKAKQFQAAKSSCEQVLAQQPEHAMAYCLLSSCFQNLNRPRLATFNAFQACKHANGSLTAREILAISAACLTVGETFLGHSVLEYIDINDKNSREALLDIGRQYSALEDQPAALRFIQRAHAEGFNGWFANHILSIIFSFTGPVENAISASESSISKNRLHGHAHWMRAQFGSKEGNALRVARMREVLTQPDLSVDDKTYLQYGIFKELDAIGDAEGAWPALAEGMKHRRGVLKFGIDRENLCFDKLIAATNNDFLEAPTKVPQEVTPIFIVGMPRTGTTLLERIIGNHPQITACGELSDFKIQLQWAADTPLPIQLNPEFGDLIPKIDFHLVGNRYLEKTHRLIEGRKFFSDKLPMNYLYAGLILKAIPHAKIINLRRHPMDACFSNMKELFAHHHYAYSYDMLEVANHYRNYSRLMKHWHKIAPGRILDVHYEHLVTQPEVEASRVQEYLGLPEVEGVTDILANKRITTTASTLQLRQPIHSKNMGGWKRYETQLEPMRLAMLDVIEEYEALL